MTQAGQKHILLVDDDKRIHLLLSCYLSPEFDIDFAASAEEALAIFHPQRHWLVITDNHMINMTGLELIRKLNGQVPCILISSNNLVQEDHEAGAVYFHNKSNHTRTLLEKVMEFSGRTIGQDWLSCEPGA